MQNLIFLIFRYSALIVFLTLQFVSFYLIISYNQSQKEIWANSSSLFAGKIHSQVQQFENFFSQKELNDSLLTENAKLLQTIINYRVFSEENSFQGYELGSDTTAQSYSLIPARVCSKTINLRNNFITLCAGKDEGIDIGMGVVSKDGVVGIVKNVSDHFSTVMLILNSQSRISAMIKNKGHHGNLLWSSSDIRQMKLTNVPKHVSLSVGDTVVTSGYSISFPPHIQIGEVSDFKILGGNNNFDIDVTLNYDLSQTRSVYVIKYDKMIQKDSLITIQNE